MAPSSLQHRRTHNLLLISKLLNNQGSSPFTLILDTLEQSGKKLCTEYARRAILAKTQVIFVSFETLRKPKHVDLSITAWRNLDGWHKEVSDALNIEPSRRKLLVFDSLNTIANVDSINLPALFSSFVRPTVSILALFHTDLLTTSAHVNAYTPSPLSLLKYLATTIFTTHAFHHVLARKAAREQSRLEPSFGLEEGIEGVLQGLGANGSGGVVLEMEHRRRSGRGVKEWYFMQILEAAFVDSGSVTTLSRENLSLLEDHPHYHSQKMAVGMSAEGDTGEIGSTFELGLTEKQRKDREGVVLPYFDAQKGGGDGGRILYDMGIEDDFDEEEDEI